MERTKVIYDNYVLFENGVVLSLKRNQFVNGTIDHGYIRIWINGKYRFLHVLLAESFIDNPYNLPYIDHIDRNKLNNELSNLRWCSNAQNSQNRKMFITNTSGEDCINRHRKNRPNYMGCYWRIIVGNRKRYEKHYNIGNLPLDATQDDIDALYKANPITDKMRNDRNDMKLKLHGEFASF